LLKLFHSVFSYASCFSSCVWELVIFSKVVYDTGMKEKGSEHMPYFFIAMIVAVTVFLIIKTVKKKSLPDNHYTPHDDIELGRPLDSKAREPESDTKHHTSYEEKKRD